MNLDYLNSIIKAWEEKKTIQVKEFVYLDKVYKWVDAPHFNPRGYGVGMLNDPTKVRVKPEVEWVPLGAKDLPFPCRIRHEGFHDNAGYNLINYINKEGVTFFHKGNDYRYSWQELFDSALMYSGTDGEWKRFRKVKE